MFKTGVLCIYLGSYGRWRGPITLYLGPMCTSGAFRQVLCSQSTLLCHIHIVSLYLKWLSAGRNKTPSKPQYQGLDGVLFLITDQCIILRCYAHILSPMVGGEGPVHYIWVQCVYLGTISK